MSRSRKKHGIYVKDKNNRYMKRQASKRVRRYPIEQKIANGSDYKKLLCSWDICDYKMVWFEKEAIEQFNERRIHNEKYSESLDDWLNYYKKCTERK